jgi:hypothetical protein
MHCAAENAMHCAFGLRRQKRKPLAQWIDVQAVRNDVLGKLRA